VGNVDLSGRSVPKEVHFKLRLPEKIPLQSVAVNGQPASLRGIHKDTVVITTGVQRRFEVIGRLG
jgi:hypothetical protein